MISAKELTRMVVEFNKNVKPTQDFINLVQKQAATVARMGGSSLILDIPSNINLHIFLDEAYSQGFGVNPVELRNVCEPIRYRLTWPTAFEESK